MHDVQIKITIPYASAVLARRTRAGDGETPASAVLPLLSDEGVRWIAAHPSHRVTVDDDAPATVASAIEALAAQEKADKDERAARKAREDEERAARIEELRAALASDPWAWDPAMLPDDERAAIYARRDAILMDAPDDQITSATMIAGHSIYGSEAHHYPRATARALAVVAEREAREKAAYRAICAALDKRDDGSRVERLDAGALPTVEIKRAIRREILTACGWACDDQEATGRAQSHVVERSDRAWRTSGDAIAGLPASITIGDARAILVADVNARYVRVEDLDRALVLGDDEPDDEGDVLRLVVEVAVKIPVIGTVSVEHVLDVHPTA